jgi:hypothetical protein
VSGRRAIVVPEAEVARRILLLNTEKAHNLREKALEVIRMARSLADLDPRPEQEFALEFEEPALVTLGPATWRRAPPAGSSSDPAADRRSRSALPRALEIRKDRAALVLELIEAVTAAVTALQHGGSNPLSSASSSPVSTRSGSSAARRWSSTRRSTRCSPPPGGSTQAGSARTSFTQPAAPPEE